MQRRQCIVLQVTVCLEISRTLLSPDKEAEHLKILKTVVGGYKGLGLTIYNNINPIHLVRQSH
jgi:hypothetical protein